MKAVILLANSDWYLYNFRIALAGRLKAAGLEVILVSPPGEYGPRLRAKGYRWIPLDFPSGTRNPLAEAKLVRDLVRLYREERPSLCHHFTIRCVLYGSLATRLAGNLPTVNAITGLGHLFTDEGMKARLIRAPVAWLYRYVLHRKRTRVVFQNAHDREVFVRLGLAPSACSRLIRGSGVDCEAFRPMTDQGESGRPLTVLFAARMLREKGIMELLEAAAILKERKVDVSFVLAGERYPGNPSSLTERAAAMGKPVVATDIPGCAGLVRHMVNGIMVPVKDGPAIADAIELLAGRPDLRKKMGEEGRKIVLGEFEEEMVNSQTRAVYRELISW